MLRGDDHCRGTHRKHRCEPTLARGQHTRPSLKKPPRFEGKLTTSLLRFRGHRRISCLGGQHASPAHADGPPTQEEKEPQMIVLGVVLLVVGFVTGIPVLVTIGGILLVIGVILWILGSMGRAVGGRKHYRSEER